MDEAELKRRTKVFGLRVFKLVEALPEISKEGLSVINLCDLERRLAQTIGLLAGLDRVLNSFHDWEWLRKRQTRAPIGWR